MSDVINRPLETDKAFKEAQRVETFNAEKKIAASKEYGELKAESRFNHAEDFHPSDQVDPQKIAQFEKNFPEPPFEGAEHVVRDATMNNWEKNVGADLHMTIANDLEPNQVKRFEQPFTPSTGETNYVDIVTKDNIAIECKNKAYSVAGGTDVRDWYDQAALRVERDATGKPHFQDAVVVTRDGALTGDALAAAEKYHANNPHVHFCERTQLRNKLAEIRR
jgi:hypothetical protein